MSIKIITYCLLVFAMLGCSNMTKNYYEEFSYKPISTDRKNLHMIIELNEAPNNLHDFSIVMRPLNSFSEHNCKIIIENIYLVDSSNIRINMPNKILNYNEKSGLFSYTNRNMVLKFTNYKIFFTQKLSNGCGASNDAVDYQFDLETNYNKKYYSFWDIIINAT